MDDNTLGNGCVYFGPGADVDWSNLDVAGTSTVTTGAAGMYVDGPTNLTIADSRVHGFQANSVMTGGANGILVSPNTKGRLTLFRVELDHNGGSNGPRHNFYSDPSATDPSYAVYFINGYSHDGVYGHLFKSRAQHTVIVNSVLEGGTPQALPGSAAYAYLGSAESYLADAPNGGVVRYRGNVFIKDQSGPNSNSTSTTFNVEGTWDQSGPGHLQNADFERNIYIAKARTSDGVNTNFPFAFNTQHAVPGGTLWRSLSSQDRQQHLHRLLPDRQSRARLPRHQRHHHGLHRPAGHPYRARVDSCCSCRPHCRCLVQPAACSFGGARRAFLF